ncbi:uncharacterized protein [Erythrolamprus reginae]|uniref:uncharacterized protein isoform X2 n=1 Tax=Erythrolamprus reginae TaxID=121349 RepID=UPI00396CF4C5
MKAAAVGPPGQDSRDHLKLPRIVWTNLVFQVPRSKIPPEVTTRKTRRQEGNLTATSKHSFRSEGGIIKRKNREGILLPLWTGGSQVNPSPGGLVSILPGSLDTNPPLSPSPKKTLVTSEKQPPRKILVDLRPLLENAMDPLDSREKKPLEKQKRSPASISGDSRKEGLPGERGGGRGVVEGGGRDQANEPPAVFPKDREIPSVHLFLPPLEASKLYRKKIKISKRNIWAPPGELTRLRKISLPTIQSFQPQLQMPLLFSKTDLRNRRPLQDKRPAEQGGPEEPTASSPDFQLPTHLLLQKLQETTTSSNHLLIAKVLRSLREELLRSHACESDQREEQENFVELSRIQSWKQGKRAKGEKAFDVTDRETAKNRLIRLIGNRNSFPQDTGVL